MDTLTRIIFFVLLYHCQYLVVKTSKPYVCDYRTKLCEYCHMVSKENYFRKLLAGRILIGVLYFNGYVGFFKLTYNIKAILTKKNYLKIIIRSFVKSTKSWYLSHIKQTFYNHNGATGALTRSSQYFFTISLLQLRHSSLVYLIIAPSCVNTAIW